MICLTQRRTPLRFLLDCFRPDVLARRLACPAVLLAVVLGVCFFAPVMVRAEAGDIETIDKAVKTAGAIGPVEMDSIRGFIATQVKHLKELTSPEGMTKAREKLVNEIKGVGDPASAAYTSAYLGEMATALRTAVAAKDIPLPAKINMGIVLHRLALNPEPSLIPLAEQMLQDSADAIAISGMKSTGSLLTVAVPLGPAKAKELLDAMTNSVSSHGFSGPLTDDFYRQIKFAVESNPAIFSVVVPALLKVYAQRVDLYKNGVPEWPASDFQPMSLLSAQAQWGNPAFSQQDQTRVMQLVVQLLTSASAQLTAAQAPSAENKEQLAALLKNTAEAIGVIGKQVNNTALVAAAAPGRGIGPNSNQAALAPVITALVNGITAAFPKAAGSPAPSATQSAVSGS